MEILNNKPRVNNSILFFPSGDRELPSADLRIYLLADELRKEELIIHGLITHGKQCLVINPFLSNEEKIMYLKYLKVPGIIVIQKTYQEFNRVSNFIPFKEKFKIIYDVDDYHPTQFNRELAEFSDAVICGSHFVLEYNKKFNSKSYLLLSPIRTELFKPLPERFDTLTICWSENWAQAFLKDLAMIEPVIKRLRERYKFDLLLQGWRKEEGLITHGLITQELITQDLKPQYQGLLRKAKEMFPFAIFDSHRPLKEFLKDGLPNLQKSHIGIMPFTEERQGKAAQNLRGFMAIGLPTVASPYGEQEYVIKHGENGFLANNEEEWERYLSELIESEELRKQIGEKAHKYISDNYSVRKYIEGFKKILEEL